MQTDRIYVFDGDKNGNRRLAKGVKSYDLDTYVAGVREGFSPELYDCVTIKCRRNQYDYSYPTVVAFVATDLPQARQDFLHYCKVLGHGPEDVTFVTFGPDGHLVSTHRTIEGALDRVTRDNQRLLEQQKSLAESRGESVTEDFQLAEARKNVADFFPLED